MSVLIRGGVLLLILVQMLPSSVCLRPESKKKLPQPLQDPDVFCETCYSTVSEMYRIIKSSADDSLESRIDGALSAVCSADLLGKYAFPAGRLTNSCRYLRAELEDDLGLGFMAAFQPGKKPRLADVISDVCINRMRACKSKKEIPSVRKRMEMKQAKNTASATDGAPKHDEVDLVSSKNSSKEASNIPTEALEDEQRTSNIDAKTQQSDRSSAEGNKKDEL